VLIDAGSGQARSTRSTLAQGRPFTLSPLRLCVRFYFVSIRGSLFVSIRDRYSCPFAVRFCNKLSSISLDGIGGKRDEIHGNRPGGKIRAGSEQ